MGDMKFFDKRMFFLPCLLECKDGTLVFFWGLGNSFVTGLCERKFLMMLFGCDKVLQKAVMFVILKNEIQFTCLKVCSR